MLKELLPPIIFNALVPKRPAKQYRLFSTYAEALQVCTPDAYEAQELIDVIFEKTKIYKDKLENETLLLNISNLALLNAIFLTGKSTVNIIDFGGAAGAHYFEIRKSLPGHVKLKYVVVETETMVKKAISFTSEELSFSSDLKVSASSMDEIDIIFSSGTLQAVDDPFGYLTNIINLEPKFILLSRLAFTLGAYDIITIHENMLSWNGNGPLPEGFVDRQVRYPFQFIRKQTFDQTMATGYDTVYRFPDDSGIFNINNEQVEGMGMLYRKR